MVRIPDIESPVSEITPCGSNYHIYTFCDGLFRI